MLQFGPVWINGHIRKNILYPTMITSLLPLFSVPPSYLDYLSPLHHKVDTEWFLWRLLVENTVFFIIKPGIYTLYSKHIYDHFITVVSSSSSKLCGLNKFSWWLAALLVVAHLETLVKQEQPQVTVHVRVHLFPSHLTWTSSPVDLRPCRMLLTLRPLLNKNSRRWLYTYVYTHFHVTWPKQVFLLTWGSAGCCSPGGSC